MVSSTFVTVGHTPSSFQYGLGRFAGNDAYGAAWFAISFNVMNFVTESFVEAFCLFAFKVSRNSIPCQVVALTFVFGISRVTFALIDSVVIHWAFSIYRVFRLAIFNLGPEIVDSKDTKYDDKACEALQSLFHFIFTLFQVLILFYGTSDALRRRAGGIFIFFFDVIQFILRCVTHIGNHVSILCVGFFDFHWFRCRWDIRVLIGLELLVC